MLEIAPPRRFLKIAVCFTSLVVIIMIMTILTTLIVELKRIEVAQEVECQSLVDMCKRYIY